MVKKLIYILFLFLNFNIFIKPENISSEQIRWQVNETFLINLEISDDFKKREIGLMNKKVLDQDKGMIFIYERLEPVNIWMYKTFIPLDIIFLKNNEIQKIQFNAKPCLKLPCEIYPSEKPIDMVIEINGGLSKELNLNVGEELIFLKN